MSLLLPAVQKARESARRMSCQNNLKQIGLAIHHYHDNHNVIPPSRLFIPTSGGDGYGTWLVLLMPYLEQEGLFLQLNPRLPFSKQQGVVIQTPLKVYFCPSRREPTSSTAGALADYAGSAGISVPSDGCYDHYPYGLGVILVGDAQLNDNGVITYWKARLTFA